MPSPSPQLGIGERRRGLWDFSCTGTTEALAGGPSRIAREEEITLREKGDDGSFQGVGMAMTTSPQEGRGQCQTPSQEGGAIRGPLRKAGSMTLGVPFGKDDIGGDPSRRGGDARVGLPQEG